MNVIRLSLISLTLLFLAVPSIAADEWRQATGPRTWSFPRDHGAHPEFRTEWWYFTGNLRDGAGNRYGYQLTFFRQGVRLKASDPKNPWSLRDLYPAQFAVTDVRNEKFHFAEQITRSGPGLAGAATVGMNVWNLGWSARMTGDRIQISARHGEMELALDLPPRKQHGGHQRDGLQDWHQPQLPMWHTHHAGCAAQGAQRLENGPAATADRHQRSP